MMQCVQNHMAGLPTDVRQRMSMIHRSVIISLQMHSVDQSVRASRQDIADQCKVFWIRQVAPLVLFGIGLTEAIRAYCVVLIPVSVSDVEGQFDASRREDLKTVALIGFQGFLGKVSVIILIHFDIFSSQYKNTPGAS